MNIKPELHHHRHFAHVGHGFGGVGEGEVFLPDGFDAGGIGRAGKPNQNLLAVFVGFADAGNRHPVRNAVEIAQVGQHPVVAGVV